MKTWIACAVAIVHLSAPACALPGLAPRAEGSHAVLHDNANANNDRSVGGAHVGNANAVRDGLLWVWSAVAGAGVQQWRINKLQSMVKHKDSLLGITVGSEPPLILLSPQNGMPFQKWEVPEVLARDAVWTECVYDYLGVKLGAPRHSAHAWAVADAITDCAKEHGRRIDPSWFDGMHETGTAYLTRSFRRATAWAENSNQGKEVRQAAPAHEGHFRDQISQFSISGMVPRWGKKLEHTFAKLGASTHHLPAYSRLLQKEAPLLKKEMMGEY
ncbi:MAG: hypothetical protein M1826_005295 [Phylliscum demangeonii]|nr:MAG: hypothetical protein M1826_005295 [Phylliscum demangeonii]